MPTKAAVFDSAQTVRLRVRRLPPMREKAMQLARWTLAIVLSVALFIDAGPLADSIGWPWLALSGILFVLAAIAVGGRRHLPFGGRA